MIFILKSVNFCDERGLKSYNFLYMYFCIF